MRRKAKGLAVLATYKQYAETNKLKARISSDNGIRGSQRAKSGAYLALPSSSPSRHVDTHIVGNALEMYENFDLIDDESAVKQGNSKEPVVLVIGAQQVS